MTMRKFMMMALLATGMVAYAGEVNDTTVIEFPKKVTVIAGDSMQIIKVKGKEGNSNFYYENSISMKGKTYERKVRKVGIDNADFDFDFGLGVNVPTNVPGDMTIRTFNSWELILGLRYCYSPDKASQTYSAGLWLNWRNFGLKDSQQFYKKDGEIMVGDYSENYSNRHSSLMVFSLSVPLFFSQKFGCDNKCKVTVGPVINLNVYGRVNNRFEQGDNDFDVNTKSIGHRPITFDIMGAFQYDGIGVYCKYSPLSVLKKDRGPQFHSLTLGVFL